MRAIPDAIHQQLRSLGVLERKGIRKYVRKDGKPSRFTWFFKCLDENQDVVGVFVFGKCKGIEVNTEQMTPIDSDLIYQLRDISQDGFARVYLEDQKGDCYWIDAFDQHERSSDAARLMCRTYEVNQTAMRNDQGLW